MSENTPRQVSLRRATGADARLVWLWRNDPAARAASFSSDEVPWETHQRWFASRIDSPTTHIWIASDPAGPALGYARFDLAADGTAEVSVALDPATRGQHWGRAVIRAACEAELRTGGIARVIAHIKEVNQASLAAFRAAGFVVDRELERGGGRAWVLHYAPGDRPL